MLSDPLTNLYKTVTRDSFGRLGGRVSASALAGGFQGRVAVYGSIQ